MTAVDRPPAETQQDDEREALRRRINQLEQLLLTEQDARDADARRNEVQQDNDLVLIMRRHRELTGSSLSWTCTCGDRSDYAEHIVALAARTSADTDMLFKRVRRLVVDHGIRDDENGELFADRLDDVLHAALDGDR